VILFNHTTAHLKRLNRTGEYEGYDLVRHQAFQLEVNMSYKLVLKYVSPEMVKSAKSDHIFIHAIFQVLVNFVEQEKGVLRRSIREIKTWIPDGRSHPPHPFEIAYANASPFSRYFYRARWRKLLAQAYLHHEIEELTGADATLHDIAYSNLIILQRDLYLWYINEYRPGAEHLTSDEDIDKKMHELVSIRGTLWVS